MEQSSDEEGYDRDITFARHLLRRVEAQWALLEECRDWVDAMSLTGCRKLGWLAFRARLRQHLGEKQG